MTGAASLSAAPMSERAKILILGGTAEAVDLANRAAAAFDVTYSLAGRTTNPALPANASVRTGGFGGTDALKTWLGDNDIRAVIDATHPFARQIARNAAAACKKPGIPRVKLLRPSWRQQPGDDWLPAADVAQAVALLPSTGARAFLSVGRQEVAAFAAVKETELVIRSIDPPDGPEDLPGATFITGRGPFSVSDERALLRDHRIDVLVSKNAGGDATYAKIAAARALGIKVIMIERPPVPPGETVYGAEAAFAWLNASVG